MDAIMKEELALMYITGKLDSVEKMKVFSLLTSDGEFREIFIQEKRLYKNLQVLKKDMSIDKSKMLFDKIMAEAQAQGIQSEKVNISKHTMDLILKNVIPEKIYELLSYTSREVIAHG